MPAPWKAVNEKFDAIWIADGSTLEELRKKLKSLQERGTVLGGKMMVVVEAFTHQPVNIWYTSDAKANDKTNARATAVSTTSGRLVNF